MIAAPKPLHLWIQALTEASDRAGWPLPRQATAEMNVVSWRNPENHRLVTLRRSLHHQQTPGQSVAWGFWDERSGVTPVLVVKEKQPPTDQAADRYALMFSNWLVDGCSEAEFRERHCTSDSTAMAHARDDATTFFGDKAQLAFEISRDTWRMWIGNKLLTRHRDGSRRLFEWLPPTELTKLCSWLSANWWALAFGADIRPPSIRDANVSACRAINDVMPWMQTDARDQDTLEQWTRHHWIRNASDRLPNLFIERMADDLIFSWNSEPTADLSWDVGYGTHGVPASYAVPMLRDMCIHMTQTGSPCDATFAKAIGSVGWEQAVKTLQAYHPSDRLNEGWLGNFGFGHQQLSDFELTGTSHHPVVGLLRSSRTTRLTLEDVGRILRRLQPAKPDTWTAIRRLAKGLDVSIDLREPWTSGYALASKIRERLATENAGLLNLDHVLDSLGITLEKADFDDPDIRGACIGAPESCPLIVLNNRCERAVGVSGRRTTIAHELCHLLFDRSLMRGLSRFESSVADGDRHIEMRANAFAIELLVPRSRLIQSDGSIVTEEAIRELSVSLEVSVTALTWHANNLRQTRRTSQLF